MSFEDLLKKKLGPMRDLVSRSTRPDPPRFEPAGLFYRRALGVEVRARPEESWATLEIAPHGRGTWHEMDAKDALAIAGLTRWRPAGEIALSPRELWTAVERDLLYFSEDDPRAPLTGSVLGLPTFSGPIARRASVWPTPAIEMAVEIAPMPFMPRGADLDGAEMVGARFASLERGVEVFGATITGTRETGRTLRALLPLLNGRHTCSEIAARVPGSEKMLALLDQLAILESAPLGWPADPRPRVTWLGHAGVLIEMDGTRVLVDPLFFSTSDPRRPDDDAPRFDPRTLPALDAVLITHGDNDHLNANALAQLPRTTPVIVPAMPDRLPPHQVDIRGVLRVLGFERVVEVAPWAGVAIGELTVTACPFTGEDWGLPLAKATYLVEGEGASIFLAADSLGMDETYARLAARPRRVDLAFMGVSGCAEAMAAPIEYGYGNFYREWIPSTRRNQWVRHCAGPKEAARALSLFSPRFAFGYASGGARYIQTSYSDTGTHAELASLLSGAATRPVSLPLGVPVAIADLTAGAERAP